jgi:hypothetical protein
MPRKQTVLERIQFALEGPSRPINYLIPYFPDEGEDNGYFENEPAELVQVSKADLQALLDMVK